MPEVIYTTENHALTACAKRKILEAIERSIQISSRIKKFQIVYITIEGNTLYINESGKAEREALVG